MAGAATTSAYDFPASPFSFAQSRIDGSSSAMSAVQKFRLLPRDLDVEHGEITPSLKLKRPVVEREYKHLIDEMYAGAREA